MERTSENRDVAVSKHATCTQSCADHIGLRAHVREAADALGVRDLYEELVSRIETMSEGIEDLRNRR